MYSIKTDAIALGSAMPYKKSMIDWLKLAFLQGSYDVIRGMMNKTGSFGTPMILFGGIKTGSGTFSISAGTMIIGNELYSFAANPSLTPAVGQVILGRVIEEYGPADPTVFSDGTSKDVHLLTAIEWSVGTSGTFGYFDYDDCQFLNIPVTSQGTYCQYSKNINRVTIQGIIGVGYEGVTNLTGTTSWQLPVSCRPTANKTAKFVYYDTSGGHDVISGQGTLTVDTNGYVTFNAFTGAGTNRYTQIYFEFNI